MSKEAYIQRGSERWGKFFWSITKTLRSTEEERVNFSAVLDKLSTNSLLIYFNHFSLFDPAFILKILDKENLLNSSVGVLASQRHLDYWRDGFVMKSVSKCKHFELLPVVQTKDHNLYENYTDLNRNSLKKAAELLRKAGNIVLIAPEGERSETGELIKAEDGMEGLFKIARKTALAYPVAMENGKILPFLTDTNVFFAKSAFGFDEISKKAKDTKNRNISITDAMMVELAQLLPAKIWGVYSNLVLDERQSIC